MKKFIPVVLVLSGLLANTAAFSKERDLNIQEDSSGLPAQLVDNITRSSVSMGVKEPLVIRSSNEGGVHYAVVSGASATVCKIKLSSGNPPQMQGLSCK